MKRDGSKARYPIEPSNVLLVELNTDDKKRLVGVKKMDANVKTGKPKVEPKSRVESKPKVELKSKTEKVKAENKLSSKSKEVGK